MALAIRCCTPDQNRVPIKDLLQEPLARIDKIHRFITVNGMFASLKNIEENMSILETYSNEINQIKQYVMKIEISCKHTIEYRIKHNNNNNNKQPSSALRADGDLRSSSAPQVPINAPRSPKSSKTNSNKIYDPKHSFLGNPGYYAQHEIVPHVHLNAITVNSPNDVPNIPLFWIRDSNVFALRIANHLIFGDIGEIYTKHTPKQEITNIALCKHGTLCEDVYCKYWHPSLGKPQSHMNFLSSSWIYTSEPFQTRNKLMRHVGNRSTLDIDLRSLVNRILTIPNSQHMCQDICARTMSQLMHDMLIYIILMQKIAFIN